MTTSRLIVSWQIALIACACLICSSSPLSAQGRAGRGGGGATPTATVPSPTSGTSFDPAQVARGEKAFAAQCASCHRANGRGGSGPGIAEVDLLRSPMVLDDQGGREIGEFLKYGRPEKKMPKFDLAPDVVTDIAAFLHREIVAASERGTYVRLNVLSGDAKAGEAFFNGPVGKCNTCHSATGDMKGLAAKNNNDASTIQGLIVGGGSAGGRGGRGGRGRGGADPAAPPPAPSATAITATVTTKSGEVFTGLPVQVTDFVIVIQPATGPTKSFIRQGDWPKIVEHNPLQAHVDLLGKYTDADIHNLAAYLVSLK
jgi:cytochrome c oxidase cbb3-type subunit 3